jgi:hypothetical protein
MEEILLRLTSELPTTGIFVFFLFYANKHITASIVMVENHLRSVNELLKACIEKQNISDERAAIEAAQKQLEQDRRDFDREKKEH